MRIAFLGNFLVDYTSETHHAKSLGELGHQVTSLHLYFDADAAALRVTFRVDGSPKIAAAISPAKGSVTLSPFIQLASR